MIMQTSPDTSRTVGAIDRNLGVEAGVHLVV